MRLSEEEAHHYYTLMWGLQFFVNQELGIHGGVPNELAYAHLSQEEKLSVRDALYEHPELIDRFVEENPLDWPAEELAIVASWKNFVADDFFIERMLKKHAIFINDDQVFGVLGILDSFDEFFHPRDLPIVVKTVLLPFKGRIIYDGLLLPYTMLFGPGISENLKETYLAAKQNRRIITRLDGEADVEPGSPPVVLPDYSSEIKELNDIARRLRSTKDAPPAWSPIFSLVRASLSMAERALEEPDNAEALWSESEKVERALNRAQTVLYRMDF